MLPPARTEACGFSFQISKFSGSAAEAFRCTTMLHSCCCHYTLCTRGRLTNQDGRKSRPFLVGLSLDFGDLCAFDAAPRHQPLPVKDKRRCIILQRGYRIILRDPFVNHNDGRTCANFPTLCHFNIANGLTGHQKHRTSAGPGACLQTPGPGRGDGCVLYILMLLPGGGAVRNPNWRYRKSSILAASVPSPHLRLAQQQPAERTMRHRLDQLHGQSGCWQNTGRMNKRSLYGDVHSLKSRNNCSRLMVTTNGSSHYCVSYCSY